MGFLTKVLKVVALLPQLIMGVEVMSGQLGHAKSGQDKVNSVLDFSKLALGFANEVAPSEVVDADAFHDGLKMVNDGVVKMLNASIWHKR